MSQSTNSKNEKLVILKNKDYFWNLEDERYQIIESLEAISDLMIPESDLHVVNREKLSCLLGYLSKRLMVITEEIDDNKDNRKAA